MTQTELAVAAGMGQNNLSRLENPDYGKHTISSLKRIADALDVALVVRFVPFSQYIDWLSGTPRMDGGISPSSLAVPSFEDEAKAGVFERTVTYYPVHSANTAPVHIESAGQQRGQQLVPKKAVASARTQFPINQQQQRTGVFEWQRKTTADQRSR